jgi:hypothetical protein
MFKDERTAIDATLRMAVSQAASGEVNVTTLNTLNAGVKDFQDAVEGQITELTPDQYISASRYLKEIKGGLRVLQQPDVAKYFSPKGTAQGNNVAELVAHMTANGLKFAPAVSGDESYYTVLYQSMAVYDDGIAQLVARPGPPPGGPTPAP